jgi:DNA replication protein DnaC
VNQLPRRLSESGTVALKFKRRLKYKSHFLYENIRPDICLQATKYLLDKPLVQQFVPQGLDTNWDKHMEKDSSSSWGEFLPSDIDLHHREHSANDTDEGSDSHSEDYEEENSNSRPTGNQDTMLYPISFDETDGNQIINVAPCEGNQPISIFTENIEELAYPTIYCGENRPSNKDRTVIVKYSDLVKSELRRSDRRAASNISNIFFKVKKLLIKQLQDKVWLSMKRLQMKGKTYIAKDFKDSDTIDHICKLDEGYRIFRTLRGSPPYWEAAKKDIFAMIRQIGLPTFFFSMSAAETHWTELLHCLGKILDDKDYSQDDLESMTWQTKSRLIRSDPVNTARYFDHRVQVFINVFLQSKMDPLGKVCDLFYRVEFQQRGSPHIHGLLWIEDAPIYGVDTNDKIEEFVDRHITCVRNPLIPDLPELVKLQVHRHSYSCRDNPKAPCRFNIPVPPMNETKLLEPLISPTEKETKEYADNWIKIEAKLKKLDADTKLTFEQFLGSLDISNEDYIKTIRSTLKDPKVFLKRPPDSINVNPYNPTVLQAWSANHDIQFITNAYACAMYIVSYISKGQRGLSELLRRACKEAKETGSDIRQQVKIMGNNFSRSLEVSAQEAVYLALQMSLRRSTRGFQFINTSPPDDRPFMLKSLSEIKDLPDDSEDIQCSNIISRYTERPVHMYNMCLADFAAWYDLKVFKKSCTPKQAKLLPDNIPENEYEENKEDNPCEADTYVSSDEESDANKQDNDTHSKLNTVVLSGGSIVRRRKKKKILRYVRYSKDKDPENHFREALMLFYPWRYEDKIIGKCETYEERYQQVKEQVELKRGEYEQNAKQIDEAEALEFNEDDTDMWNAVAPGNQHQEIQDEHLKQNNSECGDEDEFTEYDIGIDLGIKPGDSTMEETVKNRISDNEYRTLVQSLNQEQKEIFNHITKITKNSDQQQFIFISGGAGVGKTTLTLTLYQALIRHYNSDPGLNPEQASVMMVAPTGKAAYLIKGKTIHSAFGIPCNQNLEYKNLPSSKLNTFRKNLGNLKTLFIDEISMCGTNMFNFINQRLQEVMAVKCPFGGVSIICIGDLFQLRPVKDQWIFSQPSKGLAILGPNIWHDEFQLFELSKIMRQKGDQPFAETLNRLREGLQTPDDMKVLKSRCISKDDQQYDMEASHILYYNKDVNHHNFTLWHTAKTDKVTCQAVDVVIGDVSPEVKQAVLLKAPHKAGDAMGLAKEYKTAIGLRNEMTLNYDVDDGLTNGSTCITRHIQHNYSSGASVIWVEFEKADIGQKLRNASTNMYGSPNIKKSWTPIKTVTREFPVGRYQNVKVLRRQFPLQLSCAKTVHRSQGDTMEKAVIQLPNEQRTHMHYVAISRVTKLENLGIIGTFDETKVKVSQEVKEEMERLRTYRKLQLCYTPFYQMNNKLKIAFHNCQSLHLHHSDIQCDYNTMAADIILLVETKLCSTDLNKDYTLPGFTLHRNDYSPRRSAYGSVIYCHNNVTGKCSSLNKKNVEITLCDLHTPSRMQIVCIYCRPKETIRNICDALDHLSAYLCPGIPVVIMGDFNADILTKVSKATRIISKMKNAGYDQIICQPTTNSQTAIDHIYTNISMNIAQHGVFESYFSYHKLLWFAIPCDK